MISLNFDRLLWGANTCIVANSGHSRVSKIDEIWNYPSDKTRNTIDEEVNNTNNIINENHVFTQALSSSILVPWQVEEIVVPKVDGTFFCCIGVSPSQFRRLLPSRQQGANGSLRMATICARISLHYTLKQMKVITSATRVSVAVLIVDDIQKYNYAVFNNKQLQTGTALKYALNEGNEISRIFTDAVSQLPPELAECVKVIRWQDTCDDLYKQHINVLEKLCETNNEFSDLINDVVQAFIQARKPRGHFTEEKKSILRQYVLDELPALIRGITYNGQHYPTILHPVLSCKMSIDNNNHQRNSMFRLLQYIRNMKELTLFTDMQTNANMCNVYDLEIAGHYSLSTIDINTE